MTIPQTTDKCQHGIRTVQELLGHKEVCKKRLSKSELASKIGSSQPRIAKAENGDTSVSIELSIRAMLATGATPKDIGQIIAGVG